MPIAFLVFALTSPYLVLHWHTDRMANSQPTLVELAAKATELSETFTKYLKDNNVPQITFAADSPVSYSNMAPETFTLRQTLIDTLQDMWILTQGPSESVFNYVHSVSLPLDRISFICTYFNIARPFLTQQPSISSTTSTFGLPYPSTVQPRTSK
jgi:hypothetical protein